jgi:hypothetical protein
MTLASGLFRQVSIKKETTFGTAPATTLWTPLRRKRSNIDLSKETYASEEIATSQQVRDMRHGVRSIKGTIEGEMAPGAYSAIFEAMLRKDWAAGTSIALAATTLDIAGTGPTYTLTRSAGSWITDGIKAGDVVRITVGAGLTTSNLNKNLLVTAVTSATILTVIVLNGSGLVDDAATASCTVAVTGKKAWAPASGHTDYSYAIEHWHSDVVQNELFTGCKFTKADIDLPATGMSAATFEVMGQNVATATSRYSTTWNAANTAGLLAAVNGAVVVGGTAIGRLLSLKLTINSAQKGDPVVGSNILPALLAGRITCEGEFTAYFEDASIRDLFINETETSIAIALTCNNTSTSDLLTFVMPRIKLGGASKADSESALIMTCPFTGLENTTTASADLTTLAIQDSLA